MIQRISAPAVAQVGLLDRLFVALQRWLVRAEPVDVLEQRFNFLPQRFRWRGDLRRVREVTRIWEQPGGLLPARRYFEVICGQGHRFVLFQDVQLGTWHISM